MKELPRLAEQELGMSVRIGRPIHMDGLDGEKAPWSFAAISGALMFAHANYEDRSLLDDIFGRFFKWATAGQCFSLASEPPAHK